MSSPMLILLRSCEKLLNVVDKIAPFTNLRIKSNSHDWLDDEFAKSIKLRKKRLKQFK